MTTCATNLSLGFKIFPLWVCLFVCSLVALTALSSEPKTYTADYKLKAVHPGAPDTLSRMCSTSNGNSSLQVSWIFTAGTYDIRSDRTSLHLGKRSERRLSQNTDRISIHQLNDQNLSGKNPKDTSAKSHQRSLTYETAH